VRKSFNDWRYFLTIPNFGAEDMWLRHQTRLRLAFHIKNKGFAIERYTIVRSLCCWELFTYSTNIARGLLYQRQGLSFGILFTRSTFQLVFAKLDLTFYADTVLPVYGLSAVNCVYAIFHVFSSFRFGKIGANLHTYYSIFSPVQQCCRPFGI
jgi:hypothetical protein